MEQGFGVQYSLNAIRNLIQTWAIVETPDLTGPSDRLQVSPKPRIQQPAAAVDSTLHSGFRGVELTFSISKRYIKTSAASKGEAPAKLNHSSARRVLMIPASKVMIALSA